MDQGTSYYMITAFNSGGEELRLSGEPGDSFGLQVESIFDAVSAVGRLGFGWVDWEDEEPERFPVAKIEIRHFQAPRGRGSWTCNVLETIERS